MAKPKMQWVVAEIRHVVCGEAAMCCGRKVRPGQSVLCRRVEAGEAYNFRFLAFHRRCLLSMLQDSPSDHDEQSFSELRDAIVASGDFFQRSS